LDNTGQTRQPRHGGAHYDPFEERCREQGLKVTHQRRVIYQIIADGANHPSVEELYDQVHRLIPSISRDTVYRTVATFEQLGLVLRFKAPDGRYRFDTNLEPHHHLICKRCGKIEDISWSEPMLLTPPRVAGWRSITVEHVELSGICSSCK